MTQLLKYTTIFFTSLLLLSCSAQKVVASVNNNIYDYVGVTTNNQHILDDVSQSSTSVKDTELNLEENNISTIYNHSASDTAVDSSQSDLITTEDSFMISQSLPFTLTSLANNLPNEEYAIPWDSYNSLAAHEKAQVILDTFLAERNRFDNFTNILVLSDDHTAYQDNGDEFNFTNYYWSVINETTLELYNSEQEHSSYLIQDKDLGLVYLVDYTESEQSTDEHVVLEVNIIEYQFAPYN